MYKKGFLTGCFKAKKLPRIYRIWKTMKQRCCDINFKAYQKYGAIGINICDEWVKFENFYNDMYESYLKHVEEFGENETSIDRIDGTKGYYKDNCRWATRKEQQNNVKRNLSRVFLKDTDGSEINFNDLKKKYNLSYSFVTKIRKNKSNSNIILEYKIEEETRLRKEFLLNNIVFLDQLKQRHKDILFHRFGLDGTHIKKLRETGEKFGISRERVRQIEKSSIDKIKDLLDNNNNLEFNI